MSHRPAAVIAAGRLVAVAAVGEWHDLTARAPEVLDGSGSKPRLGYEAMSTGTLLTWFEATARRLPWRGAVRDPYRVLVSELMLQQTQVDRVVPRYLEFLTRFPDLATLAAADQDEVVAAWSGLGYYRRARSLHRLAREIAAAGGALPETAAELEQLPGIGPYTAAAVASLAHGEAAPVLDGNVLRVGARVLAFDGDPRTKAGRTAITGWVRGLMEGAAPGAVNEALMELGARVCTPSSPDCGRCPLAADCRALATGEPQRFPPPRRRREVEDHHWVAACCVGDDGRWLLRQVTEGPILAGLWLPPFGPLGTGEDPAAAAVALSPVPPAGPVETLAPVRHGITHRRIEVVPVRVPVPGWQPAAGWCWADPARPGLPTSSLMEKILNSNSLWLAVQSE